MLMLYTIGFFVGYDDTAGSGSLLITDQEGHPIRLFEASEWVFPRRARLAGDNVDLLLQIGEELEENIPLVTIMMNNATNDSWNDDSINNNNIDTYNDGSNSTGLEAFTQKCQSILQEDPDYSPTASSEVCIYLESTNETAHHVHLLYPGREEATPFQPPLAGAQYAVYQALWKATSTNIATTNTSMATDFSLPIAIDRIQRTPELLNADILAQQTNVALLLAPGLLHCLAAAIMVMFIIGPPHTEQTSGVVRSFVLVGVKLRTYMLTWWLYFSTHGIITAAILTAVGIFYNLMPQSSWALIFFSHYLGIVGLVAVYVCLSQVIEQEELAQGLPWLGAFGSMAVTLPCLLLVDDGVHFAVLYIASALSPFCGIMHYYAVYATYDYTGVDTGIHIGDGTVQESGLLGVFIAQVICVVFWMGSILLYSSPHARALLNQNKHHSAEKINQGSDNGNCDTGSKDNFEPLAPGSDVLLQVRGLHHTYTPDCCQSFLSKSAKPTEVLQGLDLVS